MSKPGRTVTTASLFLKHCVTIFLVSTWEDAYWLGREKDIRFREPIEKDFSFSYDLHQISEKIDTYFQNICDTCVLFGPTNFVAAWNGSLAGAKKTVQVQKVPDNQYGNQIIDCWGAKKLNQALLQIMKLIYGGSEPFRWFWNGVSWVSQRKFLQFRYPPLDAFGSFPN